MARRAAEREQTIDTRRIAHLKKLRHLLPLGEGRYLAFDMPSDLQKELEDKAGIAITCVPGAEIAKATGGVHCLTRPVYR